MGEISTIAWKIRPLYYTWRQWIEPWYLAYALLGATSSGMLPILLPLAVSHSGSAAQVGIVMAACSIGGLTSPLWGSLADFSRRYRGLLTSGMLIATLGMAVFPFTTDPGAWVALALLGGIGASGAVTIATLFIIETHPQIEWDKRIGWMRTFYGVGEVSGLLLVAVLTRVSLRLSLLTAAGLTACAVMLCWWTIPPPPDSFPRQSLYLHLQRWRFGSLPGLYHRLAPKICHEVWPILRSPFSIFLTCWLIAFSGSSSFWALYPVVMQEVYAVTPDLSSATSAVATGLCLILYSPAGAWSQRFGPKRMIQVGLIVRLLAFCSLFSLGYTQANGRSWLVLLSIICTVVSWSMLGVSGTALAALLSPIRRGAGMGLYHATSSLANMLGATLGGWVTGYWGYNAASGLAVVGVALSLILTFAVHSGEQQNLPSLASVKKSRGQ